MHLSFLWINFYNHIKPKHIFVINLIVISGNKALSLFCVPGPVIGHTTAENIVGEEEYYSNYRPYKILQQLREVLLLY